MSDASLKGRISGGNGRKGSEVNTSKLSKSAVLSIRRSDKPVADLATEFRVSGTAIRKILNRENWGWLDA
jgi:hypothetical protein